MSPINIKKVKLWMLCLIGFSLPAFADTTPDGQPILYCPQTVECDLLAFNPVAGCHLSDNPYEMWGSPTYAAD